MSFWICWNAFEIPGPNSPRYFSIELRRSSAVAAFAAALGFAAVFAGPFAPNPVAFAMLFSLSRKWELLLHPQAECRGDSLVTAREHRNLLGSCSGHDLKQ